MALPQAIIRDVGGTISLLAPVRAGAAPTVVVRDRSNTALVAATAATLENVNTTLSANPAEGDRQVTVTSAANVVVGRTYRLGPADPSAATAPYEFVRVAGIAATVLTLRDELKYDHVNATVFASTLLTYAVTGAQASTLFWDGHAEWDLDTTVHPANIWTGLECTLRGHVNLATLADVAKRDALLAARLSATHDPQALLDNAFEDVLERVGSKFRARTVVGSDAWVKPTVYRVLVELAQQYGADKALERWQSALDEAINTMLATHPADIDQDGAVEDHEGPYTTGRVYRA